MDRLTFECHKLNSGGCRLVDWGRSGMLARGIAPGGASDRASLGRLNELLEQDPASPGFEFTLDAGHWLVSGQGQIAIGGADMNWRLNGRPAELYTTIDLDGDYLLQGGAAERGARSYIAVKGEWQNLPKSWGSVSPGVPGIAPCTEGAIFEVTSAGRAAYGSDLELDKHLPELPLNVSVLPGPEWSWLGQEEQDRLLNTIWSVGPSSNHQGLRLMSTEQRVPSAGSVLKPDFSWSVNGYSFRTNPSEKLTAKDTLISSPVMPGTIQYPPSGEPILLLRYAQTLGGYPRVLILRKESDMDLLGQLKTGDHLFFSFASTA
ncbi:MAG: biotin-dependent carboxyltransferase family protein [Bacteroidota bacterium]